MLKIRLFLILGIWIAILPYLGFPYFIKNLFFSISGFFLIYLSFILYKEYLLKKPHGTKEFDNFLEKMPEEEISE